MVFPFVVWNVAASEAMRRGGLDPARGLAFSRIAGGATRVVSGALGFPTTWPASWIFALRYSLPPGRYDMMVGRYLFYRQNSLGARLELTAPAVEPFLDGAWGGAETVEGVVARCLGGRGRLFAPLDVPEDLELRFKVAAPTGPQEAAVFVNGRIAGLLPAGSGWSRSSLRTSSDFWRRELNEIVLAPTSEEQALCVADVEFVRKSRKGKGL